MRRECAHLSSADEMVKNPAYRIIVDAGTNAIPFIMDELSRNAEGWMMQCLGEIAGINPVRENHRGDILKMRDDWMEWLEPFVIEQERK